MLELPDKPLFVRGDPLRIQQIIVNLLNNSVQAAPPGQPLQLTVRLTAISQDYAELCIADDGPGIAPDIRDRVFEAFFRSSSKQSQLRGLGLGLTFSRLLAEAMGGSLVLGEPPAEGCTFVLTLPLQP